MRAGRSPGLRSWAGLATSLGDRPPWPEGAPRRRRRADVALLRCRARGGERVNTLFDRARELGARDATEDDLAAARGSRGGPGGRAGGAFSGTARTLAGGEVPAQQASPAAAGGAAPAAVVHHTIGFYEDGIFTVDDGRAWAFERMAEVCLFAFSARLALVPCAGEPRQVDDPANMPFLQAIFAGRVPQELAPQDPGQEVEVHLERRQEKYSERPKPKYRAFAGAARTLNDDAAPSPSAAPAAAAPGSWTYEVDSSMPATSIQIR